VKTAVSIPNPLFQQAEHRARQLGVSRSEFYARALERLLRQEPDLDVTRALEAIYSTEDSSLDSPLAAAQRRATAEKW
jgi:metal-responsive CopG/Arc/MetJ family transcriptional regulator